MLKRHADEVVRKASIGSGGRPAADTEQQDADNDHVHATPQPDEDEAGGGTLADVTISIEGQDGSPAAGSSGGGRGRLGQRRMSGLEMRRLSAERLRLKRMATNHIQATSPRSSGAFVVDEGEDDDDDY